MCRNIKTFKGFILFILICMPLITVVSLPKESCACYTPPPDCTSATGGAWTNNNIAPYPACLAACTSSTETILNTDKCGQTIKVVCYKPASGPCFYKYFFGNTLIGICVYTYGINNIEYQTNSSGDRIIRVRHRTRDQLTPSYKDEGTIGKYDWQVYVYNVLTGTGQGYCREGIPYGWENDGDPSACENAWW